MTMDKTEVKVCLRALLSSSAFSYSLRSLLNDFKNMTGFDLPLFGCKNPVEFLQTLTDTVQLLGDIYNPIVALVESEKSCHITSLVDRQRSKKVDFSNQFGRCSRRRLVLSSAEVPANNSWNSSIKGNFPLHTKTYLPQKTDHRRGLNLMSFENNGNQNSCRKNDEPRTNYWNPPSQVQNYRKCDPLEESAGVKKDREQNRIQTSVNQDQLNLESRNMAGESTDEFQKFLEPFPAFNQADSALSASQNNSQETEKTSSFYFEDFSDIDSLVSAENCKSPLFRKSLTPSCSINDGMKTKLKQLIKKFPNGLWCCELPGSFLEEYNFELDYRDFGCTSLIEMLSELPDVFRCVRPGNEDWILFDASLPVSDEEKKMIQLQENGKIGSDIANNLQKLLLKHCENSIDVGIELNEIQYLYQIMFDTPLDFQSLGFSSLKALIKTYEGSLLNIYDIDKKCMVLPILKVSTHSPVQWKDALPPITKDNDIFKEIFPDDVVGPEGNLPVLDLSLHIAVGQRVEVCVAEVWSPSEFCLQLNKFRNRWTRFSNDLQNFYNKHLNKYKMPDSTITPNQLCVGLYSEDPENPDEWNRARILKVVSERTIMVEFVDFGTVARVKKTQLRFLHKSFQSLPVQAFEAELYKLAPKDGYLWSMKASKKFLELSRVTYLEAELADIDFKKPILKVILYDPSYKPHLNINKQLIAENLARSLETEEEFYKSASEAAKPQTPSSMTPVHVNNFGIACDEFSDPSDTDSDVHTALFHFKMKSQKADNVRRQGEDKKAPATEKIADEFDEVSDWDKDSEGPEPKVYFEKFQEKSEESDVFEVREDTPPPKENPEEESNPVKTPNGKTKRLPPGLEHMLEVNRFGMVPPKQPDEIKKKINMLAVELFTTNPSIKQVAIQDPALGLKIAAEMAEVYIRWTCYNINPFGANYIPGGVTSESPFVLPPFPESGGFSSVVSTSPAPTITQPKKETNNDVSDATIDQPQSTAVSQKKYKYIRVEKVAEKRVHVCVISSQVYFFAEELIRTFSTFTNRDVVDRVLHLKKIVVEYKILNKTNGEKVLAEVKSFDIPGVFKKKSKKWNVYLIPAVSVVTFLQGLGRETKDLENDVTRIAAAATDNATTTMMSC